MSGTIEATNSKIINKISDVQLVIEQLQQLANILDVQKIKYQPALTSRRFFINLIADDLDALVLEYNLATIDIITTYYTNDTANRRNINENTVEFYKIVGSSNFIPRLDEYLNSARNILRLMVVEYIKQRPAPQSSGKKVTRRRTPVITNDPVGQIKSDDVLYAIVTKIHRGIEFTSKIEINITIDSPSYEICGSCQSRMNIMPTASEIVCSNSSCGEVRTLYGTASDDLATLGKDNGKSKHGKYDPHRHFRFWVERIQAKETKEFPEEHIAKIKRIIERDGVDLTYVREMRVILKETKLTIYNDHAPLLMKTFTGISPPQLTFSLLRRFSVKFNMIMGVLETIIDPTENNRPYYPFFIYKIIESEIKRCNASNERNTVDDLKRLLKYIHLQSPTTLRKNDALYKTICATLATEHIDDDFIDPDDKLEYTPTEFR